MFITDCYATNSNTMSVICKYCCHVIVVMLGVQDILQSFNTDNSCTRTGVEDVNGVCDDHGQLPWRKDVMRLN